VSASTPDQRETVELRLEAHAENLALARLALSGVAANVGASREIVSDLKLAVTEACTNVVKHAYGPDEVGEIVVRYTVEPGAITVEVEDSGGGFQPEVPSPAEASLNGNRHGMGLMIIRVLSDELDISSSTSGTRVLFVKRFSPES
jgi:serine/threonine-protein kinase RsbW